MPDHAGGVLLSIPSPLSLSVEEIITNQVINFYIQKVFDKFKCVTCLTSFFLL